MKASQVILVLLGALSVEAIRINITKEGDDVKVPEDIVKDAASKGLMDKDSAAVADVAGDVARLEKKLAADRQASLDQQRAKAAEKSGIEIHEEAQAAAEKRMEARDRNQAIQAKLSGIDAMARNNRKVEEIAAEHEEAERLNKIQAEKDAAESRSKKEREEHLANIKEYRSEHIQASVLNRTETADEAWASNMGAHILSFDKSATFWDETSGHNATRSAPLPEELDKSEDKEAEGKGAKKEPEAAKKDEKKTEEKKAEAPKAEEKTEEKK